VRVDGLEIDTFHLRNIENYNVVYAKRQIYQ
jgi:hypothetical protein